MWLLPVLSFAEDESTNLFAQLWISPQTQWERMAFNSGLGQREPGSCGETGNVNLNKSDNVIISKSTEPSRWEVMLSTATFHPAIVWPWDRGHDCRSHPEDLRPPPPNSQSACRLIKAPRSEESVWMTRPKSMSLFCLLVAWGHGGDEAFASYLNPPHDRPSPPSTRAGLPAFQWDEHCQIYTLPWFPPTLDNPFPE